MSATLPPAGRAAAVSLATHLGLIADGMEAAATALPVGPATWSGPAAQAVGDLLATRPAAFREIAVACRRASSVLAAHAEVLAEASALVRAAATRPGPEATGLERRAADLVAESARASTGALAGLAATAPRPVGRGARLLGRLDDWRAEVALGAGESTEAIVATAGRLVLVAGSRPTTQTPDRLVARLQAVGETLAHPVRLVKVVIDWHTWRTNPARAVGHLVPDLLAALCSGGAAAGARGAEISARADSALARSVARDASRRAPMAVRARAARQWQVTRAVTDRGPAAGAWRGPGGTWLSAAQNAAAQGFHARSAAMAPRLQAVLERAVATGPGRLKGLVHRVKTLDSFRRKLSGHLARGGSLATGLQTSMDLVRFTAVIDEGSYTRAVQAIGAELDRAGLNLEKAHNTWPPGSRYRALNTTWIDPGSGVSLEIQFHTPATWQATQATHPGYEVFRLDDTPPLQKAALAADIQAAYDAAAMPPWAQVLDRQTLPPSRPDPFELPPDITRRVTIAGAGTTHLLTGAGREGRDDAGPRSTRP